MRCNYCGAEVKEGMKYCPGCGKEIQQGKGSSDHGSGTIFQPGEEQKREQETPITPRSPQKPPKNKKNEKEEKKSTDHSDLGAGSDSGSRRSCFDLLCEVSGKKNCKPDQQR